MLEQGVIRYVVIDRNPDISDTNYALLLAEDSLRSLALRGMIFLLITGNYIGDAGAKALANALKVNRMLIALDLFDNRIQRFGAEALGEVNNLSNLVFKSEYMSTILEFGQERIRG